LVAADFADGPAAGAIATGVTAVSASAASAAIHGVRFIGYSSEGQGW